MTERRLRIPAVGLSVFLVIATILTWSVYVTLRRDVRGATAPYAAVFTDVYGLREGDDVRIAGVRVGRVEQIALDGIRAKVSFRVASEQRLPTSTVASVDYQNVVGQRFLALAPGRGDTGATLAPGSVLGVDHTEPSFDVGALLNGYEPLFAVLDPDQVNNLTKAVVGSFQGDTAALTLLVDQTSELTRTFVGGDHTLDQVIAGLDGLIGNLAAQDGNLEQTIVQTRTAVAALDDRRRELIASAGAVTAVAGNLGRIAADVQPTLHDMLTRQPGFAQHMLDIEPQIAYTGLNTPLLLKGLSRIFGEGAYMNAYGCDVNVYGFFPGLNDVVPIIIDAATPGGRAMHTPKCRSVAGG